MHHIVCYVYLNYYLSGAVCAVCVCLRLRKYFPVIRFWWTDISNSRIQARRAWFLYIIFSLKVKTVETHASTSLTYFLSYSCTDVISINISIYVFSCLVFILFLYEFCKSISRTRSFEKLRVIILELFHPIVH